MRKALSRTLSGALIFAIVLSEISSIFLYIPPKEAEAAQVTIDNTVEGTGTTHIKSGTQTVFIDDQTGYKFFRDVGGYCVYRKTTDGGASWSSTTTIDSQTDCIQLSVWYDRWTPNDFGDTIHIVTADTTGDELYYNAIDTANSDTRLTGAAAANTNNGGALGGVYGAGVNYPAITKATDGTIYIAINDAAAGASYILRCSSSCGTTASWTTVGTSPLDAVDGDQNLLVPLTGGEVMLINRDVSLEDIRYRIWNGTNWGSAWILIDGNAPDNTTYDVGMAFTLASSTSAATTTIFMAYIADNNDFTTQDHDIRTAIYQNGIWATSTTANPTVNVVDNASGGLTNVAIARDQNTGNLYVAYNRRTTISSATSANTYWRYSTTSMRSWSAESGAINSGADDMYGVDLNIMSNQRIYATWMDGTDDDIFGETVADLVPGIIVSATGTQTGPVTASTTGTYVGGKFVFNEYLETRDVTAITIEETGTIDAQNAIGNVKLFYESDTTFPYDCASVSYDGSESQFGSTDTNGFSGADGTSAFTGTSASIATSSALCVYPVMDVLDAAANGTTINVQIANPSSDITITGGGEVRPQTAVDIASSTQVLNDNLTQSRYHFRNDNGTETTATSRTGGVENTNLTAIQQATSTRLRIEVSNEGGATSPAVQYRLEYSLATSTCEAATQWTDVGATADEWDMYNSANLTEGANTTNIAAGANGAVTDDNTSFLVANGGVRDISSQTGSLTATSTQFIEFEYSIIASTTAAEGNSYCFRLTNAGVPLTTYSAYPRATIAADVAVSATSSQTAQADVPTTDFYIGGAYVIAENTGSRNVTSITITENGTVDGTTGLDNIRLRYELDSVAPYDCASVSYNGTESLFGSSDTDGFSSANGTSTFTGSVTISTTSAMCVYPVMDITTSARNGETIDIVIAQPSTEVVVTGGGSVSPSVTRDITGSTTLRGPVLTQTHYHWRNDNGSEAAATSATGGSQDTALSTLADGTPIRLRLQVSNEGATTSAAVQYRLEYAPKTTVCSAASGWTDVGDSGGAWDMFASTNLTEAANTTNIAIAIGGVADENTSFISTNGGVRETTSQTGSITATSTQFVELEYSIEQTTSAGYSQPYCFRVTNAGTALDAYSIYGELTTAAERDFKIQRGTSTISGTTLTITAGAEYTAPAASTSAFIRITNSQHTGAGSTLAGATQNADDVTAYILNPSNIMTSVTFARAPTATGDTRISWEIIEFIGEAGSDNEMIVRQQGFIPYAVAGLQATATAATGIVDDADVVVFITGLGNPDTAAADYNTGLSTSAWNASTNQAVFNRGEASGDVASTSYAVVEFTGPNWQIQRAEHTYTAAGVAETEDITSVNSLARTFIHTQKRSGTAMQGIDEYGHEVWLSSVGQLTFQLQSGATSPTLQTSVVWVIENIQTSTGDMTVTRSFGTLSGGTGPLTTSVEIETGYTLSDLTNASIFINNRGVGTGTNFPRPIIGAIIASTTHYELWRSNTGAAADYRTEIVEWPVAGLALRQNDYQFYVDNDALDPTDRWGNPDIGENTPITSTDEPPGDDDVVRIRMSIEVANASMPTSTQAFKLQFAQRSTTCAAVSSGNWADLGDAASSTIWRGYDAPGTIDGTALSGNPFTPGDLNLTAVSDVAGTLEEENTSALNPYSVADGQDIEYDWFVQMNGATAETSYCFRMTKADGAPLDAYNDYPQIRTASFTPKSQNWRWYDDSANLTPTSALAAENTAPIDVSGTNTIKLRVTIKETKNISRDDVRFRLQYSEYSDFSTSTDVVATSSCTSTSTWCYADGGGADNSVIQSRVLTDGDACVAGVGDGCGTRVESADVLSGFRHEAHAATEYEFTIVGAAPRVNRTYFFRLYSNSQDAPVSVNDGESYPSLVTEGTHLVLSTSGLATSTVIEGVTTDITTTPTSIAFGALTPNTSYEAAQRFTMTTNSTEGFRMLMYSDSPFISSHGESIAHIAASNTNPLGWATACVTDARGCYGYHVGDDTLSEGSTRFSPVDTYAAFETTPREVAYSSIPVTGEEVDIIYRVFIRELQPAGQYETTITFVTLPVF